MPTFNNATLAGLIFLLITGYSHTTLAAAPSLGNIDNCIRQAAQKMEENKKTSVKRVMNSCRTEVNAFLAQIPKEARQQVRKQIRQKARQIYKLRGT